MNAATRTLLARCLRAVIATALAGGFFGYVFRLHTPEWRTAGLGDWIDPYLINNVLEQWYYSVRHLSDPASPPMFYPVTGTMGYSHGLILYAPFYILMRVWTHPF